MSEFAMPREYDEYFRTYESYTGYRVFRFSYSEEGVMAQEYDEIAEHPVAEEWLFLPCWEGSLKEAAAEFGRIL